MRAIRIDQPGGPEVMRLDEVELPPPGKGEVRLRQHAIGINFIDIYHRTGFYPAARTPFTPGSEGAGEVVENPVRQPRLAAAKKRMGDTDILAHRHPRRDVGAARQLIGAGLEDQPQDRFEAPERPFLAERRREG